jgi:LmbE family N-acetylglucosaminyl deacetylase
MKKIFSLLVALYSFVFNVEAQQIRPLSSTAIYQKLEQLNTLGTVMYVAAHPDDENTRLISYLVHHDHVRTVYLSLTRGDGGQNILGSEQGKVLGLIRTNELVAARAIDGAEQAFASVMDFGFTKSPEETFKFWNRQALVDAVIQAYQKYKPDVVICRFPTTGEGGHGQHTVSAIVAEEAYVQLQEAKKKNPNLWLPKRLLFNAFKFGDRSTINEQQQSKIPINQYNTLLGEGYGEMAGRSRSVHKSQGAGTPQTVGVAMEYFKHLQGDSMSSTLYDGVNTSWARIGQERIGKEIQQILQHFNFNNPSTHLPALANVKKQILRVEDTFWRTQKLLEIDEIMRSCSGVMIEALSPQVTYTAGATLPIQLQIVARSSYAAQLKGIKVQSNYLSGVVDTIFPILLPNDTVVKISIKAELNALTPLTQPYWMIQPNTVGAFQYDVPYGGVPNTPNEIYVTVSLNIQGADLNIAVPVSFKHLDPVQGDVIQPIRVVPDVSITPLQSLYVTQGKQGKVGVRLKAFTMVKNATVQVLSGDKIVQEIANINIKEGKDTLIWCAIQDTLLQGEVLKFKVTHAQRVFDKNWHLITYNHLPDLQYFTDAEVKVLPKQWSVTAKKIGYIEGAGDHVASVLSELGLQVEYITEAMINDAALLHHYDAIVLGVRTLNTQAQMNTWMPLLLKYVADGGNLIVQYNTNQNLVTQQYGPYPFTISRDRVTEEDAVVTFTNPNAALLQYPNRITQHDFDNWVQERGVYYPTAYENNYKTLLSMHDVNEKPLESGILYCNYGKGTYIYTSLVFFRQLPAANLGAIRLFMNLLSAGK